MGTKGSCTAINNDDGTQTFIYSGKTDSQKAKGTGKKPSQIPDEQAVPVETKPKSTSKKPTTKRR